ncbi:MAG: hypothetical protein KDE51_12415, partial [Anaerolineales bacterium]|nr:hypothetical protein [Anaerolineales bacterium]
QSPEHSRGEPITAQSDVYSLAVMFYEMVTGQIPRGQRNLRYFDPTPVLPSELNLSLPAAIDDVLLKGLAVSVDQRYGTVAEFQKALEGAIFQTPIDALLEPVEGGTAGRRKWLLPVGCMTAVVIGVLALVLMPPARRMNGVATVQAIAGITYTPTASNTPTVTATPTFTFTPTATPTATSTSTPTASFTPTPTSTPTATPTFTPSPTPIQSPTVTPLPPVINLGNVTRMTEEFDLTLQDEIQQIAVSPDKTIVALVNNSSLALYRTSDLSVIRRWPLRMQEPFLQWSADGEYLLVGQSNEEVAGLQFWHQDNPEQLQPLLEGENRAVTAVWSPNEQMLAVGGTDNTITIWERDNWSIPLKLEGHQEDVTVLAWGADSRLLASGSSDNLVIIWDVDFAESGQLNGVTQRHVLSEHSSDIVKLGWSFSADDPKLFSLSAGNVLFGWNTETGGRELRTSPVLDAVWYPDRNQLLVTNDNRIAIRSTEVSGWPTQSFLSGHTRAVEQLHWSPAGDLTLASIGQDWSIRLWDMEGLSEKQRLANFTEQPELMVWSDDGQQILTSTTIQTAVWSVEDGQLNGRIDGHNGVLKQAVWLSNHATLLTLGTADSILRLISTTQDYNSIAQLSDYANLTGTQAEIRTLTWSSETRNSACPQRLAVLYGDDVVRIWDVNTRTVLQAIAQPARQVDEDFLVTDLAWSPDGCELATANLDGNVRIWEAQTGRLRQVLNHNNQPVILVEWAPDERLNALATITSHESGSSRIYIWDPQTGQQRLSRSNLLSETYRLAWSYDDPEIALSGFSGTGSVYIMNTETGERLRWLSNHNPAGVSDIGWSQDTNFLASVGLADRSIRIWNAAIWDPTEGQQVDVIEEAHRSGILSVDWSPDSQLIVTLGGDRRLAFWDWDAPAPLVHEISGFNLQMTTSANTFHWLAWSPDGIRIALFAAPNQIKIYSIPN